MMKYCDSGIPVVDARDSSAEKEKKKLKVGTREKTVRTKEKPGH